MDEDIQLRWWERTSHGNYINTFVMLWGGRERRVTESEVDGDGRISNGGRLWGSQTKGMDRKKSA